MIIRSAVSQDLEPILRLATRLAETGTPAGRSRADVVAADHKAIQEAFKAPRPRTEVLVATLDDAIVAFIHLETVIDYYRQEPIGHISNLVVAEHAEGKGVGTALIGAAENWARSLRYHSLQLNVLVANASARKLYEGRGYVPEWMKYLKHLG